MSAMYTEINATAAGATPRARRTIERNRWYGQRLGWDGYRTAIMRTIAPQHTSWDEATFVREISRWQARTGLPADGIVGPHTWSYLRVVVGLAKDPLINVQIPSQGQGFHAYRLPGRRFARTETVRALLTVAQGWQHDHPRGPRIGIGEVSLRGGGPIDRHGSHRLGLDADLRPVRSDGGENEVVWQSPYYSRALTQELVDRLRANGVLPVLFILFNDKAVLGVQHWRKHDDHLHVRFRPPSPPGAR
jgi:hypothetical protein